MIHNCKDLFTKNGDDIIRGLLEVKKRRLVKKIGYSIYFPDELEQLLPLFSPDLVQAPLNVFDQRLITSGWLNRLAEANIDIHTRSIFLQGLLLIPPTHRPKKFLRWPELWKRWDLLTHGSPQTAIEICFGFLKSKTEITKLVVGVETEAHLLELVDSWKNALPFSAENLECEDTLLLNPYNWRKL